MRFYQKSTHTINKSRHVVCEILTIFVKENFSWRKPKGHFGKLLDKKIAAKCQVPTYEITTWKKRSGFEFCSPIRPNNKYIKKTWITSIFYRVWARKTETKPKNEKTEPILKLTVLVFKNKKTDFFRFGSVLCFKTEPI